MVCCPVMAVKTAGQNSIKFCDTREDVAGLKHAKSTITEAIIWPMRRPELFQGIRAPPKGIVVKLCLLNSSPNDGQDCYCLALLVGLCRLLVSRSASVLTDEFIDW